MLRVTLDVLASHPVDGGLEGRGLGEKILLLLASEINLDKLRPESFLACLTCMQDLTRLLTILFLHIKFGRGSI